MQWRAGSVSLGGALAVPAAVFGVVRSYVGKGGGYLNDVWMTIDQKTGRWDVEPNSPRNVVPIVKATLNW